MDYYQGKKVKKSFFKELYLTDPPIVKVVAELMAHPVCCAVHKSIFPAFIYLAKSILISA
jgi:hypothetical protein